MRHEILGDHLSRFHVGQVIQGGLKFSNGERYVVRRLFMRLGYTVIQAAPISNADVAEMYDGLGNA